MRKGLITLRARLATSNDAVPQKAEIETAAAYVSRLDRLLEPATEARIEEPSANDSPARSVQTKARRRRSQHRGN